MATKKNNKSELISLRLTTEEYEPYKLLMKDLDIGKSAFFRALLTNKLGVVQLENNKDYKRMLFLNNKISNNINQIAKRLNTDAKKGIITQRSYNLAINNLISIKQQLKRMLDKC
ncbi:plasmid mobilization protein [Photobacterium damselae]|uniref:plasmid mobilization protein n=1 Tax=Photobacterium damselae TaxID=38293 RepID=UPI000A2FE1F3|nr:plasmid mobilization relaxosome protein MobC [Photobacterium damselae]ARR51943.1 relaxosome protein [Photobacterium damselae subsp. damselae]